MNRLLVALTLAVADGAALIASGVASWWVKWIENPLLPAGSYLEALPAVVGIQWAIFAALGLYPGLGLSSAGELRRTSYGLTALAAAVTAYTFLSQRGELWSRQIVLTTWVIALLLVPMVRVFVRRLASRWPRWGISTVVLGAGATGARVVALLESRPWLGLRAVAILDDDPSKQGLQVGRLTVSGTIDALPRLAAEGVQHAILAMPGLPGERLTVMLDRIMPHVRHIYLAPALPGCPQVVAEVREFSHTLVLELRQNLLLPTNRCLKRTIDLAGALLGLLACSWLLLLIAAAVALTSRGPVFFGQRRLGQGGRPFTAWKFRTMVRDAEARLQAYLAEHPEARAEWELTQKLKHDPRVTRLGALLRRTSLDELPQLWNIVRGEMSLVGPRPIVEAEVPRYGACFPLYCQVRPGLSGLWQVSGRNETSYDERVALDAYYVRNWSVWLDLVIIAKTLLVVLRGRGAY